MPELPEVETVKEVLKKRYINKTISNVIINYDNILANISPTDFINKIKGQTITSFDRIGKFIIVNLTSSKLLVHLRMEGKFKFDKSLKQRSILEDTSLIASKECILENTPLFLEI